MRDHKVIRRNVEKLYNKGDILMCPLCHVPHYKLMRDIYKGDRMTPGQVETCSDEIINPAINVSGACQFCHDGGVVPLVEVVPGKELKKHG